MEFSIGELVVLSEVGKKMTMSSIIGVKSKKTRPLKVLRVRQINEISKIISLETFENKKINRPYRASHFRRATENEVKKYQLYTMYQKE